MVIVSNGCISPYEKKEGKKRPRVYLALVLTIYTILSVLNFYTFQRAYNGISIDVTVLDRLATFTTSFTESFDDNENDDDENDTTKSSPSDGDEDDETTNTLHAFLDDHSNVTNSDNNNRDENAATNRRGLSHGPIQMPVHYYEMWDHQTSSIQVPDEHRYFGKDKRTSLEILQDIIHSKKDQAGNDHVRDFNPDTLPKCFVPNTAPARQLADDINGGKVELSNDPVLYVGFPKTGTTTLWHFFECSGYMASHQQQCPMVVEENLRGMGRGETLLETKWTRMQRRTINNKAKAQGKTRRQRAIMQRNMKVAHLQLDNNGNEGCYPQIQLLDELHQDYPNATFIMAFRPIDEWIRSVTSHQAMNKRWGLFEMPGLVLTDDQLALRNRTDLPLRERRPTLTDQQLRRWWCGHVQHIREYVQEYPSHRLIELDLYNEETSSILADIFQSKTSCWGHKNKNEELAEGIQNGTIPEVPKSGPKAKKRRRRKLPSP
jgi:Sulfotransferase domain